MSTPRDRTTLARWLMAYEPADSLEAEHRSRMQALLEAPGDPFRRDHWAPGHFTASAFVRSPDRSRLLLIHHEKLGRWLQPGGHVEAGDADLMAAARREVREETGVSELAPALDGIFDVDVHAFPARGGDPAHLHFDVRFLFDAAGDALRRGSEVRDARWFPLEDVTERESDRSVTRPVEKLLQRPR